MTDESELRGDGVTMDTRDDERQHEPTPPSERPTRARVVLKLVLGVTCVLALGGLYFSCDGGEANVFRSVAAPAALKSSGAAKLEQARVLMDRKRYTAAADLLEPVIDDESSDSNDARMLYAAAKLGESGLDVWQIIESVLTAQDSKTATKSGPDGKGGLDQVLDSLGEAVLGSGEERAARIEALEDALNTLDNAPDPEAKRLRNTACLYGGILAVPIIADAKVALGRMEDALGQIRDGALNGGDNCPNISLLDDAAADVADVAASLGLILDAAKNCPFLDLSATTAAKNAVEEQLVTIKANADKGCDTLPTCAAGDGTCAALFPPCVQSALAVGTGAARAGDGVISACELILHCAVGGSCFH